LIQYGLGVRFERCKINHRADALRQVHQQPPASLSPSLLS
jgi:hypothetical protein